MTFEHHTREQLVARLGELGAEASAEKREHERLIHDLQVHQLDLELQNRDLREVQRALEESRNRYADLYDFAPIAYFTFDAHGCIREVNLTGATLIGGDRAQLVGAPFPVLVQMADPAQFWAHLRQCDGARVPVVTEFTLTARDASVRLRAISRAAAGPDGAPIEVRTAFIDITDRHRAELARDQALEVSRRMQRELEALDRVKTVVARSLASAREHSVRAVLRVVVDEARALVDVDQVALGIGGELGERQATWCHSGSAPPSTAALAAETTIRVPVWFGEQVLGTLYLIGKRGGGELVADDQRTVESLARYVGVATEIARLGDEARASVRSRDNVLAIVSHDMRGPLSAVSISAGLLQRMLAAAELAAPRRQAETIGRAAGQMTRFINDLLTASTLDAGHLSVTLRPESMARIIAEAADLLAGEVADSSLQLHTEVPADLPAGLCDRERIHQVLGNLVGNAVKFTPAGGLITIAVAQRGDHLEISVTDTGPGIPLATQSLIFERYWQEHGAAGTGRGVGLGLYICQGIVQNHLGRIWVDSTPGQGATFTFTVRVAGAGA